MCLPIVVASWPPFAMTNSPLGPSRIVLGNSRVSAVCANAFENSSWTIGFAIAVGVAEPPHAVAIEDVNLLVADGQRQRLVQARREPPPLDDTVGRRQALHDPDVAVERDAGPGAIGEELDVADANTALPRIRLRQRHIVHDVGVSGC